MSNKFKVGDIVTGKKGDKQYTITNGDMTRAVVTKVLGNSTIDIKVLEHSSYRFAVGEEYRVNSAHFEMVHPVRNWKVVIIPDGDKTVGKLYENGKVVKEVSTVKSRHDEYNMNEAIKVITERLTAEKKEELKPKRYNGKVVCTDVCGWDKYYKLGKIYDVVDGELLDENGNHVLSIFCNYCSFDDLVKRSDAKWIEVIE